MDWRALKSAAAQGTLAAELRRQFLGNTSIDLSSIARSPSQRRFMSDNLESFRSAMPTLRSGRANLRSAKSTATKYVGKAKNLVTNKSMTRSK